MNVYADQNFLIYCVKNPAWRKAVANAHRSGRITLVLSPWHFYECGKGLPHDDVSGIVTVAEELQPKWIIERADLQFFEFWIVWRQIWESSKDRVEQIGTFREIVSILSKVDTTVMPEVTMRDYVDEFAKGEALAEIKAALDGQMSVTQTIRKEYQRLRTDRALRAELELRHLSLLFARWELKIKASPALYRYSKELSFRQPLRTQMELFIEWGFMRELHCYETEVALSHELHDSGAMLNANRFVDRQHATMALPYCDCFVTDDQDLIKRCERIRPEVKFPLAPVMTGQELIDSL